MCKTTFTLKTSLGETKKNSLEVNNCNKNPTSLSEKIGDCNYYIERFKDFMERHKNCKHEPPEYYFGKLREKGKLTMEEKCIIYLRTCSSTRLAILGETETQIEIKDREKKRLKEDEHSPYKYKRGEVEKVPMPEHSYGYKYCIAFTKLLNKKQGYTLSAKGKEWLIRTKLRLQKNIEKGVVEKYYISTFNNKYNLRNSLVLEKEIHCGNEKIEIIILPSTGFLPIMRTYSEKNKKIGICSRYVPIGTKEINKFYENIELDNKKFQDFAFATHPDAYNPEEMSKLPIDDLVIIGLTPEFKEFLKKETWEQIGIVWDNINLKEVSEASWERLKEIIKDKGMKIIEKTKENLKKIWEYIF